MYIYIYIYSKKMAVLEGKRSHAKGKNYVPLSGLRYRGF